LTIVEPLPSGGYGKADWVDYSNYWRELDAEWLMERAILRYATPAARATQYPTPGFGMTTYNEQVDKLEMYSKTAAAWGTIQAFVYLTSTADTASGVNVSHKNAGGKGIIFEPTRTQLDNPIWVMGGVLGVNLTGVTVKTGARTATLTTDATNLVSDSPISAPGGTLTGPLTATAITLSGTLTAQSGISLSGTLTGGVLNGSSGTIGGVALSGNFVNASVGLVSQQGYFQGDGSSALMRQRNPSNGAIGTSYLQVTIGDIVAGGNGSFYMYPSLRIMGGKGIPWHNAGGSHVAWISPCIYSATDPGAANYPDGTLWIS
jgi:hypothetical protein